MKEYRLRIEDFEAEEAAFQSQEGTRELAMRLLDRVAYLQGDLFECDWCGEDVRGTAQDYAGRLEGEYYTREGDRARFCGSSCLVAWRRAVDASGQAGAAAKQVEFCRLRDEARKQ